MPRPRALRKAYMTTVPGLPQRHAWPHLPGTGQAACRHEWIVERIHHQGGHPNMGEKWLGRCAMPIVFRIAKAMHRRSEYVVKSVEITGGQERLPVKKTRVLLNASQLSPQAA